MSKNLNSDWFNQNVKPKPLDTIPPNGKITNKLKPVDVPKKPLPDTELSIKDAKTILKSYLTQETLELIAGKGWGIDRWVRLVILFLIILVLVVL